ncbi:MAG: 4Fe-4S cluster-binding domain-containing protein [Gammaproteobacteria bacterium]|nr:4Fe-4S cluster-binding domain-containing protein [Gammaproteobacteria bacterium]
MHLRYSRDVTANNPSTPLSGLHLLLTYECNFECDHCFVWGAPSQSGTMTGESIDHILAEAAAPGTIEWIYFEGGEAFLYYETLRRGVLKAKERGFNVGIVTNAYWATSDADALRCLQPLAGLIDDLSISSDVYHGGPEGSEYPEIARNAARKLGMPVDFISVAKPEAAGVRGAAGKLPAGESAVLYRGRAAELLAPRVDTECWERFTECPWEDLRHPERLHVDPFGYLHVCQGISIGNMFERPLADIMADYDPVMHPIVGPLLAGGPAEIVRRYELAHESGYADHCHLCYAMRCALRERFADVLAPHQMYGTR